MSRLVTSRILLGLATLLFASGCSLDFVGLHPAVRKPGLSRFGTLLALSSLPPWMTAMQWQNRQVSDAQLRDARLSGYETAMNQLHDYPDAHPGVSVRVPRQGRPTGDTRKSGL
jgi:hypothetical protein